MKYRRKDDQTDHNDGAGQIIMPDISIQYYATPDETCSFIKEIMTNYGLYALAMRYQPFEAEEVTEAEVEKYFVLSSEYQRWAFTIDPPNLPVEHELDHADKNPDHLRIEVGRCDDTYLGESWLTCRTENKAAFAIWKKVAKELKKQTFSGITVTGRKNGISGEYPKDRYTKGAKALEDSGIQMITLVGPNGPIVKLGLLLSHPPE